MNLNGYYIGQNFLSLTKNFLRVGGPVIMVIHVFQGSLYPRPLRTQRGAGEHRLRPHPAQGPAAERAGEEGGRAGGEEPSQRSHGGLQCPQEGDAGARVQEKEERETI